MFFFSDLLKKVIKWLEKVTWNYEKVLVVAETFSEHSQTSKMESFAKITALAVNYIWKKFHVRCLKGSEFASECCWISQLKWNGATKMKSNELTYDC